MHHLGRKTRRGNAEVRVYPAVVPAHAGTHNHRAFIVAREPSNSTSQHLRRGVWVPARAEPVVGRAFARPDGLAGTTVNWLFDM